jgi:hypothetical protein
MKKKDLKRELAEAHERIKLLHARLDDLTINRLLNDRERPEFDHRGRRLAASVGRCPECGHQVFEFKDTFACVDSATGECSFSIDRFYLDWVTTVDEPETMGMLLAEGEMTYWFSPCDPDEEEPDYNCHVKLVRSDDGRWYFDYVPIALPAEGH